MYTGVRRRGNHARSRRRLHFGRAFDTAERKLEFVTICFVASEPGFAATNLVTIVVAFPRRSTVPSKKKKSKFKIGTEARRRARLGIGLPPHERTIVEKRLKKPKHNQTLKDVLSEE